TPSSRSSVATRWAKPPATRAATWRRWRSAPSRPVIRVTSQRCSMADPVAGTRPGGGPAVVLIGPPGAGKSTVAKALASRTGWTVRDTDDDVERAAGRSVSEIFTQSGEAEFRRMEREAV